MSIPSAVEDRHADSDFCETCSAEGPAWTFPVEGNDCPMCAACIEKYCAEFAAEYGLCGSEQDDEDTYRERVEDES